MLTDCAHGVVDIAVECSTLAADTLYLTTAERSYIPGSFVGYAPFPSNPNLLK
jgi:hypothetical protein